MKIFETTATISIDYIACWDKVIFEYNWTAIEHSIELHQFIHKLNGCGYQKLCDYIVWAYCLLKPQYNRNRSVCLYIVLLFVAHRCCLMTKMMTTGCRCDDRRRRRLCCCCCCRRSPSLFHNHRNTWPVRFSTVPIVLLTFDRHTESVRKSFSFIEQRWTGSLIEHCNFVSTKRHCPSFFLLSLQIFTKHLTCLII